MNHQAVLLFSGGLDSTVLLWHLRATGYDVQTLAFSYGQRHARELNAAQKIDPNVRVLSIPDIQTIKPPVPSGHYADPVQTATIVPNRNMVLLALAASYALDRGIGTVAYGAHGGDAAIYPDCRAAFVEALGRALALGNPQPICLLAPFLSWTKVDIVRHGVALGAPLDLTWSCYRGEAKPCGTCGACTERDEAFQGVHS